MVYGAPLRSLRELYFRSSLSHWRLDRKGPRRIILSTSDAWPGDAEFGRAILDGKLGNIQIQNGVSIWGRMSEDKMSMEFFHGFSWLRHLRDFGGDTARKTARDLVGGWLDSFDRWHSIAWRPDITGERISSWIGMHDFFCDSAEDQFRQRVLRSIGRQMDHLARDLESVPKGIRRFRAIRGMVISGVALGESDDRLNLAERVLSREVVEQINPDGGHVSRSPSVQTEILMNLIDIRNAYRARSWLIPELVDDAIDRMAIMLRLWRHGDGKLALFNKTIEGTPHLLKSVIAQSESRNKAALIAGDTGFNRLTAGRTCVIVDTGIPSQQDHCAHASPLAFELSSGKHRLVVNCGTSLDDHRWQGPLRASSAHSMLIVDNQNAAEITADGHTGGRPTLVHHSRKQIQGATLLNTYHDGYLPTYGLIHHRNFYLSSSGDDFRGEDRLVYSGDPGNLANEAVIRFHIHPRVSVSIIQNGTSALLRLPTGGWWKFRTNSLLKLNESVYFGTQTRQRAEQVVIIKSLNGIRERGEISIKWAIRREDGRS